MASVRRDEVMIVAKLALTSKHGAPEFGPALKRFMHGSQGSRLPVSNYTSIPTEQDQRYPGDHHHAPEQSLGQPFFAEHQVAV